jgi:regulatory protein
VNDPSREAMDAALFLLKFRGRSEKELGERLAKKGFEAGISSATIARLKELNLVNDESLAKGLTEGGRRAGRGEIRLRQDLWKRGIPRDIIQRVLSEQPLEGENVPPDESARARDALAKRLKRFKTEGLDRRTIYGRLGGYLARQGFSPDVVRDTLDGFFRNKPSSDDPSDI